MSGPDVFNPNRLRSQTTGSITIVSRKLAFIVGTAAMLMGSQMAAAQEGGTVKAFSSLSYQLTFDSSDRPNSEGHGIHLSGGYFFTPNLAAEIAAEYSRFGGEPQTIGGTTYDRDGDSLNLKVGGLFAFNRGGLIEPYVGLGGGLANNELDEPNDNRRRAFGEVTLGVFSYPSVNFGLRGEFAYRYTDGIPTNPPGTAKSSANEAMLRLGVLFPLVREVPVVAGDAAGDAAEPRREVSDSDGDGVPDNMDECPGTPKGVRVNARGCPIDSDADGVPDYKDECPGTAAGVQVDEVGCPQDVSIDRKFEDINFGFDKAALTDYAKSTLDKTAAEIRQLIAEDSELRVDLEGHTDSVGPEAYNKGLGERRAAVVRDYLVEKGVGAARISTSSAGESDPIASNETDKGRLLNRRVEVRAVSGD